MELPLVWDVGPWCAAHYRAVTARPWHVITHARSPNDRLGPAASKYECKSGGGNRLVRNTPRGPLKRTGRAERVHQQRCQRRARQARHMRPRLLPSGPSGDDPRSTVRLDAAYPVRQPASCAASASTRAAEPAIASSPRGDVTATSIIVRRSHRTGGWSDREEDRRGSPDRSAVATRTLTVLCVTARTGALQPSLKLASKPLPSHALFLHMHMATCTAHALAPLRSGAFF